VDPSQVDLHPHPERLAPAPLPLRDLPQLMEVDLSPSVGTIPLVAERDSPYLPSQIDDLIVTDERRWPAQEPFASADSLIPLDPNPHDPTGDMGAAFSRLANAKQARGLKTALVLLSDIVAGSYGD